MNCCSASRNSCSTVVMLSPNSFQMFAALLAGLEIPEQPVVVWNKLAELPIPLLGEFAVQPLQERQQRPLRFVTVFMFVQRYLILPSEFLPIRSEAEPIEEILAADDWDVPQTRDAARILFDRDFSLQPGQQFRAFRIVPQVIAQLMQRREIDGRTDEQH